MAFRHVWAVGRLAKKPADTQAQKAFKATVYSVAKKDKADKKK